MIKELTIRLYPTIEQELLMRKHIGCIDGLDIPNINTTRVVKDLEKKLIILQRQCSHKYQMNKKGVCYQKTTNIANIELKIKKLHRKLKNIRLNHVHQATQVPTTNES